MLEPNAPFYLAINHNDNENQTTKTSEFGQDVAGKDLAGFLKPGK